MGTVNSLTPALIDDLCVNTLRFLAVDMVQEANSGDPGLPLGSAATAFALWVRVLKFNPGDPDWPDRDRFVLSAGHGSTLLYALLHVTGYDLLLEDLQQFRQWGSRTTGHPENGKTTCVEATTGPLGQGVAHAVGMAIAEVALGGCILVDPAQCMRPEFILIATGSEIHVALASRERLAEDNTQARVVSIPSTNNSEQSGFYRERVLPPGVPLLAIEAGTSLGWNSYIGPQSSGIAVNTFGASAPGSVVMQQFGFTIENVCAKAHDILNNISTS